MEAGHEDYQPIMKETITFTEFQKMNIRIGTVVQAERVERSEKLVKLTVNLGDETRQVVAGIGKVVADPLDLVGRQIPVLANLEPKKLMGIESQGMILAADDAGAPVLLHPTAKVPDGAVVR